MCAYRCACAYARSIQEAVERFLRTLPGSIINKQGDGDMIIKRPIIYVNTVDDMVCIYTEEVNTSCFGAFPLIN